MYMQQLRCAKIVSRIELLHEVYIMLAIEEEVQTHNSLCQLKESSTLDKC